MVESESISLAGVGLATPAKAGFPSRIGMVATDPLRVAGLQAIVIGAGATIVPLSVPGILNDGSLMIVVIDASCTDHLFELLETFRRMRPQMRLIVLGDSDEQEYIQRVIGAGAKGYLTQAAKEAEIRLSLEIVNDGSVWAPRKVLARLLDIPDRAGRRGEDTEVRFTEREVEVLRLLVTGLGNREIALALKIREQTVKAHLSRLMRKVGVTNRIGLTLHALGRDLEAATGASSG